MKLLAKIFCSVALVSIIAGCASKSSVYVPKVPDGVKQALLDYETQPDNKVFILAVDPGGDYAYAYEYGQATLKEAAKIAVEKVDVQRKEMGVVARPYVYALNDKVVWEEMVRAAAGETAAEEDRAAQKAEAEEMMAEGAVEEAAPAEAPAE
jgi:hypothetical protein